MKFQTFLRRIMSMFRARHMHNGGNCVPIRSDIASGPAASRY